MNQTAQLDRDPSRIKRPIWASLGIGFYIAHSAFYLGRHQPEHLLWACHVASALAGIAWLMRSAMLNSIALLWLGLGAPLWVLDVTGGGWWIPSSILTHIGGFIVALAGLKEFGFPREAWWRAILGLLSLNLLCRFITPAPSNVNVAFAVWRDPLSTPQIHRWYLLAIAAGNSAGFFIAELILHRLRPYPKTPFTK